jgi:hypothetical protein
MHRFIKWRFLNYIRYTSQNGTKVTIMNDVKEILRQYSSFCLNELEKSRKLSGKRASLRFEILTPKPPECWRPARGMRLIEIIWVKFVNCWCTKCSCRTKRKVRGDGSPDACILTRRSVWNAVVSEHRCVPSKYWNILRRFLQGETD